MSGVGAIVLAGGRGSRLGGADKAALELDGARLVDRAVAAARACGADPVVVVGPSSAAPPGTIAAREDPPFSGPLAALAAGLAALPEPQPFSEATRADPRHDQWTLLLACDLVEPARVCETLVAALGEAAGTAYDGFLLDDPEGRRQWLAGAYRTAALRAGIAAAGPRLADLPLKLAFAGARLHRIAVPSEITADIDAPEDLERARARAPDREPESEEHP